MDTIDYAKCYKVLSLPHDVSLQELDDRYYEMVEYWALQVRDGVKEAKPELQKIDDAYGVLLKKHNESPRGCAVPRRMGIHHAADREWSGAHCQAKHER